MPKRVESSLTRDHSLAARLVAADESALVEAYRAHAPAVYGMARRVLTNPALAEEVTQDVFVRLWEQPERFDAERGALRSFLLAMTHSRAVERVRAEEAQRRRYEAANRQPVAVEDRPADPAATVVENQAAATVRDAVAALPAEQRVAIEMAYWGGLSYREVADALGEAEGTVKYRIRSGMRKLRGVLNEVAE